MARLGAEVVGADASATNIEVARPHASRTGVAVDYRATTAEALADAGETFDVVLNMEVVEHVADVDFFMATCASMVSPGGMMFVATINRTLKAPGLAIFGAEYVLRWLPRGTHHSKAGAPRGARKPLGAERHDRSSTAPASSSIRLPTAGTCRRTWTSTTWCWPSGRPRPREVTFLQYRRPAAWHQRDECHQRHSPNCCECSPMNADDMRRMTLQMPEAEEKSHFGTPDFRVRNRIFASLPDAERAVVKLTRERQEMLAGAEPAIFAAVTGGWGGRADEDGLAAADEMTLKSALTTAWRNVAPATLRRACSRGNGRDEMTGRPETPTKAAARWLRPSRGTWSPKATRSPPGIMWRDFRGRARDARYGGGTWRWTSPAGPARRRC